MLLKSTSDADPNNNYLTSLFSTSNTSPFYQIRKILALCATHLTLPNKATKVRQFYKTTVLLLTVCLGTIKRIGYIFENFIVLHRSAGNQIQTAFRQWISSQSNSRSIIINQPIYAQCSRYLSQIHYAALDTCHHAQWHALSAPRCNYDTSTCQLSSLYRTYYTNKLLISWRVQLWRVRRATHWATRSCLKCSTFLRCFIVYRRTRKDCWSNTNTPFWTRACLSLVRGHFVRLKTNLFANRICRTS